MNIYIHMDFKKKYLKYKSKYVGLKRNYFENEYEKLLKKLENKNIILNPDDKQKIMLLIKKLKESENNLKNNLKKMGYDENYLENESKILKKIKRNDKELNFIIAIGPTSKEIQTGESYIKIDGEKKMVNLFFWKQIIKMITDCFYDSLVYTYRERNMLDEYGQILKLINSKDFIKKKSFILNGREYDEEKFLIKFCIPMYGHSFTSETTEMFILVKPSLDSSSNKYIPISTLTLWTYNPDLPSDSTDYYIGGFCTKLEERGKKYGKFLLENILKEHTGKFISLSVFKENEDHSVKTHDKLVSFYKGYGFKFFRDLKDLTVLKKLY